MAVQWPAGVRVATPSSTGVATPAVGGASVVVNAASVHAATVRRAMPAQRWAATSWSPTPPTVKVCKSSATLATSPRAAVGIVRSCTAASAGSFVAAPPVVPAAVTVTAAAAPALSGGGGGGMRAGARAAVVNCHAPVQKKVVHPVPRLQTAAISYAAPVTLSPVAARTPPASLGGSPVTARGHSNHVALHAHPAVTSRQALSYSPAFTGRRWAVPTSWRPTSTPPAPRDLLDSKQSVAVSQSPPRGNAASVSLAAAAQASTLAAHRAVAVVTVTPPKSRPATPKPGGSCAIRGSFSASPPDRSYMRWNNTSANSNEGITGSPINASQLDAAPLSRTLDQSSVSIAMGTSQDPLELSQQCSSTTTPLVSAVLRSPGRTRSEPPGSPGATPPEALPPVLPPVPMPPLPQAPQEEEQQQCQGHERVQPVHERSQGHAQSLSPPWASREVPAPRIPQTQVLTLNSLQLDRAAERGGHNGYATVSSPSFDVSTTQLPQESPISFAQQEATFTQTSVPVEQSNQTMLSPLEGSITQLMPQESPGSFGSVETTKTLVIAQALAEGQMSTTSTAKTLPMVHVTNHAYIPPYVPAASAETLSFQDEVRFPSHRRSHHLVPEVNIQGHFMSQPSQYSQQQQQQPQFEGGEPRPATPVLHQFTPRSLVYTMSSASASSSGARGVNTDDSSLIGTLCTTPASHFSPNTSAPGSLRSSTAKSPKRRRSKSSEDGTSHSHSPFLPLAPSAAAAAAAAATAAVAAAASPGLIQAQQHAQVLTSCPMPELHSPRMVAIAGAPDQARSHCAAVAAAFAARAPNAPPAAAKASARSKPAGASQRSPAVSPLSMQPREVPTGGSATVASIAARATAVPRTTRSVPGELRMLSPTVMCSAMPQGRAPSRMPIPASGSPGRPIRLLPASAAGSPSLTTGPGSPATASRSSTTPPPRSPSRELRSCPQAAATVVAAAAAGAAAAVVATECCLSPPMEFRAPLGEVRSPVAVRRSNSHTGHVEEGQSIAMEWVRKYRAEHARSPASPEQLQAFVNNRGGSITYRDARGAIKAVG